MSPASAAGLRSRSGGGTGRAEGADPADLGPAVNVARLHLEGEFEARARRTTQSGSSGPRRQLGPGHSRAGLGLGSAGTRRRSRSSSRRSEEWEDDAEGGRTPGGDSRPPPQVCSFAIPAQPGCGRVRAVRTGADVAETCAALAARTRPTVSSPRPPGPGRGDSDVPEGLVEALRGAACSLSESAAPSPPRAGRRKLDGTGGCAPAADLSIRNQTR